MPNGFYYLQSLDRPISSIRDVWLFLLLPCFIEIPVFNVNSVDPDQMPHYAASDLGLHCLPMSLLWDARHGLNCLQSEKYEKNINALLFDHLLTKLSAVR